MKITSSPQMKPSFCKPSSPLKATRTKKANLASKKTTKTTLNEKYTPAWNKFKISGQLIYYCQKKE